jgi:hypothetical protein
MSIKRREPSKIYNAVVEANGFVFVTGITPKTLTRDVKVRLKRSSPRSIAS